MKPECSVLLWPYLAITGTTLCFANDTVSDIESNGFMGCGRWRGGRGGCAGHTRANLPVMAMGAPVGVWTAELLGSILCVVTGDSAATCCDDNKSGQNKQTPKALRR